MSMPSYWYDPFVGGGANIGASQGAALDASMRAQQANQQNQLAQWNTYDPWANTPGGFGAQTAYYQQQAANSYGNINSSTLTPSSVGYSQPAAPPQPQHNVFDYGTSAFNPYGGVGGLQTFDPGKYYQQNPDVFSSGTDAWTHYNQFGKNEGRQGTWADSFNSSNYLANNPDVYAAGADPTQHWFQYGAKEGRTGGGGEHAFDTKNYLANNPDVWKAGADPIKHWLDYGQKEGRTGGWGENPFNAQEYLLENRDVAAAGADPLQHWLNFGSKEGRQGTYGATEAGDWNSYFNQPTPGGRDAIAAAYLQTNPDVFDAAKASGRDPTAFGLEHLWNYGVGEGRTGFDNAGYLAQNPDVAAAGANPFQHYVNYGYNEGRQGAWLGSGDDYWGRGYMASDDPYGFGDPTGVGGSGYGDGFGGYGSAEDNPWGLPPGANVADPKSFFVYSDPGANPWQDTRQAFYDELTNNPDRMYEMAVRGYLELKRDPTGRQGVFEAMFNQKAARPELDPLRHKYFPHNVEKDPAAPAYLRELANTRATLMNQPELLAKLYGEIGRAYSSNITQGATDWASGKVADRSGNRTTETYKSPVEGERYFIKNIPNLYDGPAAGRANAAWLLGIQQQLPDYHWPGS